MILPLLPLLFSVIACQESQHVLRANSNNALFTLKRQNTTLCDARSAQYTGWINLGANSKQLFFWFFESEDDPQRDPLTLWLTGGPGGSSMLGMLHELGPCLINAHGNGTTRNEFGWARRSSLLFVDQPAGVGFSHVEPGVHVPATSEEAALDMDAFLRVFVRDVFPDLQRVPFHVAGESYAGHYVPALGAQIVKGNAQYPLDTHVNLESILVGNGLYSFRDNLFGYWETLCTTHSGIAAPVFNSTRCDAIAASLPGCMSLLTACNSDRNNVVCDAAGRYCYGEIVDLFYSEAGMVGGRNSFDITAKCLGMDDYCYPQAAWIEEYLNTPHVRESLGVPSHVKRWRWASDRVAFAFARTADAEFSTRPHLQFLLNSGVDVLLYQGNLDLVCNTAGNLKTANDMPWKGQPAFYSTPMSPWFSGGDDDVPSGTLKQVSIETREGERPVTFAFVTFDGAGHMVPVARPEASLEMVNRWISNRRV